MANEKPKKKGCRKAGRNRETCARYRAEGRREKNKKRRAARHAKNHPNDKVCEGE